MSSYNFGRTPIGIKRVNPEGGNEFQGRPIIGRDTKIAGGVYIGASAREAIVIDFNKDEYLLELFESVKSASIDTTGKINKQFILKNVYDIVSKTMVADSQAVDNLITEEGLENDRKVTLGLFISAGIGVCRHQNLACAAILERFVEEGILGGKVSIDRNTSSEGGHAWCRYTNSVGKVFILDVTQNYIGEINHGEYWDYRRPEEKELDQNQ